LPFYIFNIQFINDLLTFYQPAKRCGKAGLLFEE